MNRNDLRWVGNSVVCGCQNGGSEPLRVVTEEIGSSPLCLLGWIQICSDSLNREVESRFNRTE
jgi:hypothetical protein